MTYETRRRFLGNMLAAAGAIVATPALASLSLEPKPDKAIENKVNELIATHGNVVSARRELNNAQAAVYLPVTGFSNTYSGRRMNLWDGVRSLTPGCNVPLRTRWPVSHTIQAAGYALVDEDGGQRLVALEIGDTSRAVGPGKEFPEQETVSMRYVRIAKTPALKGDAVQVAEWMKSGNVRNLQWYAMRARQSTILDLGANGISEERIQCRELSRSDMIGEEDDIPNPVAKYGTMGDHVTLYTGDLPRVIREGSFGDRKIGARRSSSPIALAAGNQRAITTRYEQTLDGLMTMQTRELGNLASEKKKQDARTQREVGDLVKQL